MKMNFLFIVGVVCFLGVTVASLEADVTQWRGLDRSGTYPAEGLLKTWPAEGPELLWTAQGLGGSYASVIVIGERIFTTSNGTGANEGKEVIQAINKKDGSLLWTTVYGTLPPEERYRVARSTPTYIDGKLYVVSGAGEATCLDMDGKVLWTNVFSASHECKTNTFGFALSPLVHDGKVIFTCAAKEGAVIALDAATGEKAWLSPVLPGNAAFVSPTVIEHKGKKQVVGMTSDCLFGLDSADGKITWSLKLKQLGELFGGKVGNINAVTPVFYEGLVISSSGYGTGTYAAKLDDSLEKAEWAWVNPDLDSQHNGIVIAKDTVWGMSQKGDFCAVDAKTGKLLYKEKGSKGNILAADNMLYCYGEKGQVALMEMALDKFTPVGILKVNAGTEQHWSHPVIDSDGVLYVRHGDALMAYSLKQK